MKVFIIGGTIAKPDEQTYADERSVMAGSMERLGRDIIARGHDLLICSPFPLSADLDAVRGAALPFQTASTSNIEFHCPDAPSVRQELEKLIEKLSLSRAQQFYYPVNANESGTIQWTYTWLLAQISAMDRSDVIIALGGQPAGSASLLLAIAESRRKRVLPLTFAGGAAAAFFQKCQYQLQDRLSDKITVLHEVRRTGEAVELAETLITDELRSSMRSANTRVFISYPRARPEEADFVEMTLRRRNYEVYRDERDFGAGLQVHSEIAEHIHKSTIFLVIWCKEYACSPWCYDELEIALKRQKAGDLTLWFLRVDDTRIVPPDARNLISYWARSREELQSHVLTLIEQIQGP
jgi:hypothetical protein